MELEHSTILVTGGAGFIGSNIVKSLVEEGADVIVYDNFSTGSRNKLKPVLDKIEIVEADILDWDRLTTACQGVDAISHQAAQLEITSAIEEPESDLETNTTGSLNVFKAAHEHSVEKVVYASSACVYGQADEVPQSEDHRTEPNWPYGVSKLAVDKYAEIFGQYYDIPLIGLRYGITYGPQEWYGRVMTVFLKRALSGEPPVVWGGDQIRDFIHVDDAVALHNECLRKGLPTTQFNVGTGVATTIRKLAEAVVEVTGMDQDVLYEDIDEGESSNHVERDRLPMELQRMQLDPSKAKRLLDWEPTVGLNEGLERQWDWLQDHEERWTEASY